MSKSTVVIVGDSICGTDGEHKMVTDAGETYLRGFNTFSGNNPSATALSMEGAGEIIAAVNGVVEVTERVVSVKGRLSRYLPEIGDVIVGRITEVSGNRWRVDVNANLEAVMLLSNVTEPGGMLRRRGRGDELGMRQIFDQEDLVAAEVQRISPEGIISLHTRAGDKYGKLANYGVLVKVRPSLVKRVKHQFYTMPKYHCQLVIGMNGYIWVSLLKESDATEGDGDVADLEVESRQGVARVVNCIRALGGAGVQIYPASVESVVETSVKLGISSFDVLLPQNQDALAVEARESLGTKRFRE